MSMAVQYHARSPTAQHLCVHSGSAIIQTHFNVFQNTHKTCPRNLQELYEKIRLNNKKLFTIAAYHNAIVCTELRRWNGKRPAAFDDTVAQRTRNGLVARNAARHDKRPN